MSRDHRDWRMAQEITVALRVFCPGDPVKLDYPPEAHRLLRTLHSARERGLRSLPDPPWASGKADKEPK